MRIKHFAGYGYVNAKKIMRKEHNSVVYLHIQVCGNHECGLIREDKYDFFYWLGKRLDKKLTSYSQIIKLNTEYEYEQREGEDVCNYYVIYKLMEV